jgi:hypothetical protein
MSDVAAAPAVTDTLAEPPTLINLDDDIFDFEAVN